MGEERRGHPVSLSAQREQTLAVVFMLEESGLRPLADKMSAVLEINFLVSAT